MPSVIHPTLQDLMSQSDALPSIPRIVSQILRELDMDDPNPRNIVMLASTDPALTAKIIALANSVMFNTGRTIACLDEAVQRLGFMNIRAVVTTAALASSFKNVPSFDLEQFWGYSLNAALVAKTLARNFRLPEGPAFTAGLVHGIGELILRIGAPDSMAELKHVPFLDRSRIREELRLLGYSYADASALFLEQWDFPEDLVHSMRVFASSVAGHTDEEQPDPMAAIVHLASWRARTQVIRDIPQADDFPEIAATALHLTLHDVLEKDPSEWTSAGQVAALLN